MRSPQVTTRTGRRGVLSMELVLVLPILGTLLLGLFEFSLLFFARSEVVDCCRIGARKATMPGVTAAAVQDEVLACLSPRLRSRAEVAVEAGAYSGDPVYVAVRVPMADAAPDLLWPIGFRLEGNHLVYEARMSKE